MNPTAVQAAVKNNSRWIISSASGGQAVTTMGVVAGEEAKGYLALNFNRLGTNYPVIKDIKKYVVDKGKSQTQKDTFARKFL